MERKRQIGTIIGERTSVAGASASVGRRAGRALALAALFIVVLVALASSRAEAAATYASFVGTDTTTQGNWRGVYGSDGDEVFEDGAHLPSYAQVTPSGYSDYVWAGSTTDVRAPQKDTNPNDRIAGCIFSGNGPSFTVDINVTDGNVHQVAFYMLDWDSYGPRQAYVEAFDTTNGGQVFQGYTYLSSYTGGTYVLFNVSGHITFTFYNLLYSNSNVVLSGIFFDPKTQSGTPYPGYGGSATFVQADTATQGNWKYNYGAQAAAIVGDPANSYPFAYGSNSSGWGEIYATSSPSQAVWSGSTGDVRALQKPDNLADRIAATLYDPYALSFYAFASGQPQLLGFYLLDWDGNNSRSMTVVVQDYYTGVVLDQRDIANFSGGVYLQWRISGYALIRFFNDVNGSNAVVSGMFVGGPSPNVALATSVVPIGVQPPGTDLAYTIAFANTGGTYAQSLVVTDPIPANTAFKLGSASLNLATTGLSAVLSYSNDGGNTYTYTPVSGGGGAPAGYDATVTQIRWTFNGSLSQTAPNNTGTTSFTARIL